MAHVTPPAVVQAVTLNMRAKQITEPLIKKSPVFAMVQQKGGMKMNQGGLGITWPVRYKRRSINTGGSPLNNTFYEVNRIINATLPWRIYQLGEGLSKFTILATKNDPNSYLDAFDKQFKWTLEDFTVDLAKKVYVDGAASGSRELYGFESLFNGTAVASNARVGTPAGTYAGITSTLANYGGTFTTESSEAWPNGDGSDQYDFWAPLQIDTSNTKWSDTTKDWANNWQEQVTWCRSMMAKRNGDPPDAMLVTPFMLTQAKQNVLSNQRFELTQNPDTIEAGVKAMTVEGMDFIEDARIIAAAGAGIGYAVTWDKLEICCMGSQLVESDTDMDITTKNKQIALDSHIQMKAESPCYFAKFAEIS